MKQMLEEATGVPVPTDDAAIGGEQDDLNRRGAMDLARRLERYWHDRGDYTARFWAEPIDERFAKIGTREVYRVECNLVNGLPPMYRDQTPNR